MKKILSVLAITSMFACNSSNKDASTTASERRAADSIRLVHLKEVEWPKAYREQDTVLLDRILGEDFQMIDNNGNWSTKDEELAWIRENRIAHDSFFYQIKRFDVLDNGTALICGTGHIFNDSTKAVYQSSNILVKRNEQWKAVSSHLSGYNIIE